MDKFKSLLPYLGAVLFFIALAALYFWPVIEGKALPQMDNTHSVGMAQELNELEAETGEKAQWTNSMFGGMPAYQIKADSSANIFSYLNRYSRLGLPYHTIAILFLYLAGFFVMARSMGFNLLLSILGSIAFAFGSYNLIIIIAGHITKAYAIALMAPVIGGILYTYNRNKWGGALFTALALGAEIAYNHVQITYYLAILVLILVLDRLYRAIVDKSMRNFLQRTALLVVAAVLALLPNITGLWTTYEYGKESIRGESLLIDNAEEQKTSGLDPDYVFAWSYGKAETLTLLIPNFNGGGSRPIGMNADLTAGLPQRVNDYLISHGYNYGEHQQDFVRQLSGEIMQQPQYWGSKPFTEGPVYVGSIICFLFVLALFFYHGREKWWLVAGTILSILLAWGNNLEWFNMFMLNHFPLYNKFRTVEMTLVIASLTIPLLAVLGLKTVLVNPSLLRDNSGKFLLALAFSGGLALVFYLFPGILNLISDAELNAINSSKAAQPEQAFIYDLFIQELQHSRGELLKTDAFRSFLFIMLASASIWLYVRGIISKKYLLPGLILLVIIDMWGLDRRYINNDSYITPQQARQQFLPSTADNIVASDSDLHYRVFSIDRNVFNEVHTSYFHSSIGGYHGAKLQRYQDLIEWYLNDNWQMLRLAAQQEDPEAAIRHSLSRMPALNMLNTKYIIYNGDSKPVINPYAMGNAWLVNNVRIVSSAREEILGIGEVDLSTTAIVSEEFADLMATQTVGAESGNIELIDYHPERMSYRSETGSEQLAIFSEIYYRAGWKAYVNDKEVPLIRANYLLRAIFVPEGTNTIELRFEPQSYRYGKILAYIGSFILFVLLVYYLLRRKKIGLSDEERNGLEE